MDFAWRFSIFENLALIMYYFWIKSFLNAWLSNSFPQVYLIISGLVYLHIRSCYTRLDIVSAFLSLHCTILNHPVSWSIIIKAFIMIGSYWYSPLFLYGPIISTENMSQGMPPASFVGKWTYFYSYFFISDKFSNFNVGPTPPPPPRLNQYQCLLIVA